MIDKEFKENKGSDLRTLFDNKIGLSTIQVKNIGIPEKVTLWVSKEMANYFKSMPLHKSQTHIEYDGYGAILISLQLVPTYELLALVLSYGKHMELITPKWLRKEIERELERSIFKYKRS